MGVIRPSGLKFALGQHDATRQPTGRTNLPNLRQILQVSETCFGGDPRLFDRRVQRWLGRRRELSGITVLGGVRSGANARAQRPGCEQHEHAVRCSARLDRLSCEEAKDNLHDMTRILFENRVGWLVESH